MAPADRHQPLADIGAGGDAHAEPEFGMLVDEAPVGAEQEAALGLGEGEDVAGDPVTHPVEDASVGRFELAGEELQQRRLAGTRFTDHGEDLAGEEVEADVAAAEAGAVELGQALGGQQRGVHVHRAVHVDAHSAAPAIAAGASPSRAPRWPSARRSSQWSVSEQTNMRPPASSVMTSSR